jgi:hypothetical protein
MWSLGRRESSPFWQTPRFTRAPTSTYPPEGWFWPCSLAFVARWCCLLALRGHLRRPGRNLGCVGAVLGEGCSTGVPRLKPGSGALSFWRGRKSGGIALPSLPRRFLAGNMRRTQGQCPCGCANPKACTNPHGAADSLDCKRSSRVSCTIYAGYGALGGRHQTFQFSPGWFHDEIGHRFHKLSTVCGSGVVGEVDGDPAIPGAPCRPAPWTQSGWTA